MDYDWLIIGSGFGGSVSALRLSEKGYKDGVVEAGRRIPDEDVAESSWQLKPFHRAPQLALRRWRRQYRLRQHAVPRQAGILSEFAMVRAC
jgi:cholesterol oxidase